MCLSSVYSVKDGSEDLICEFVSDIRVNGPQIKLTDVIGQESVVTGSLLSVDLVNNKIRIAQG